MKYIQKFEGFFGNLFRRKSYGVYHWTEDELFELKNLGFKGDSSIHSFEYKIDSSDTVEHIVINKCAEIVSGREDYFYEVRLDYYKKNKIDYKDFDSFNKMINFVKKYVSEEEISANKYNL